MLLDRIRAIAAASAISVRVGPRVPALVWPAWFPGGRPQGTPVHQVSRDTSTRTGSAPDPRRPGSFGAAHEDPADAYAGVPILQRPAWNTEIAAYFYFGGISSGAYLLGALADLAGERWRPLARTAYAVSFAAMIPCAPLLIDDLGRPERFHHMLRIFKPSSPMNLGSWTLLAHGGFATLLAAQGAFPVANRLPRRVLGAAGMAPAMTLGGYSGVLLGTTSVPVWSTSPMLGGLFMASAVASGTSAVALTSIASGRDHPAEHAALGAIGIAAGATELGLAGGFLATSGNAATPLLRGGEGALFLGAVASSLAAIALEVAGIRSRSRGLSALAAGFTLAGGAMLRFAVVRAGHASALDRDANLEAMRQTEQNPGWGPPSVDGRAL